MADLIASAALTGMPHAFLDGSQSDAGRFDLVAHSAGPVVARQVHSALALVVDAPFAGDPPEVDGLATATPGLALAIRTADCAPVLLADRQAGVVGAAHAGWRGAHGGVIAATVAAMEQLGANRGRIAAAIGPCVARASYEVDEPFRAHFSAADDRFFAASRTGRWLFDLPRYVWAALEAEGIGVIDGLGLDTYALEGRFHSHRRSTHRGTPNDGRQFSLIALPF